MSKKIVDEPLGERRARPVRPLRTATSETMMALDVALRFWVAFVARAEHAEQNKSKEPMADRERYFVDKILGAALADADNGGEAREAKLLESTEVMLPNIMYVAVGYAADSLSAVARGDDAIGWSFACDANYWAGILWAAWVSKSTHQSKGSALAGERHKVMNVRIDAALTEFFADPQWRHVKMNKAAEVLGNKYYVATKTVQNALTKKKKTLS